MALKDKIAAYQKASAGKVSDEMKAVMGDSIAKVQESLGKRSLPKTGEAFPEFSLSDSKGNTVTLSELRKNGPVVITMFRGGW